MSGDPGTATTTRRSQVPVVAAVAIGGGIGALARYELATTWPTAPGQFPWTTFFVNVTGCFLIGVLMVLVTEVKVHHLVRPFLGVGVLGGFTTFSTYTVEIHGLLKAGSAGMALAYLGGTLLTAGLAVLAGVAVTRLLAGR
ncbi:fluoride efflux transporter FluC [Amycolatopsis methanolica]|uniref:Fluoride-specific ion channel FluC n=1 Tax=Amycolatopsis methanolica 239 TaxID=1068978 RepID=A0A076MZM7_AMYME|nr:CrcB family protein [Amycolatopsis methanolica]AIJ26829.1 camphor resistance protein CrcB [Amycolatopsis methanolica 239]